MTPEEIAVDLVKNSTIMGLNPRVSPGVYKTYIEEFSGAIRKGQDEIKRQEKILRSKIKSETIRDIIRVAKETQDLETLIECLELMDEGYIVRDK